MTPEFWTARLPDADARLADPASIAAQNERLRALDPAVRSLESMPDTIAGDQVRAWIGALSRRPVQPLFDGHGVEVTPAELDDLVGRAGTGRCSRDPGDTIRPRHPSRFAQDLSDGAAGIQPAWRHRPRPLPGVRILSGHAGRGGAQGPQRRLGLRRRRVLRGVDGGGSRRDRRAWQRARVRSTRTFADRDGTAGAHAALPRRAHAFRAGAGHGRQGTAARGLAGGCAGERGERRRCLRDRIAGAHARRWPANRTRRCCLVPPMSAPRRSSTRAAS